MSVGRKAQKRRNRGKRNYEYAGMHRNLEFHGCSAEPVTPDLVETLTYQDGAGGWPAFFRTGSVEGARVLGFLIHAPGHWISILPSSGDHRDLVDILCDSLYDCIFHLNGEELAELLEAMALRLADGLHGSKSEWSACRVFVK